MLVRRHDGTTHNSASVMIAGARQWLYDHIGDQIDARPVQARRITWTAMEMTLSWPQPSANSPARFALTKFHLQQVNAKGEITLIQKH